MATIGSECVESLCHLLETDQTNKDPNSFQNSHADLLTFDSPESRGKISVSLTNKCNRSAEAFSSWHENVIDVLSGHVWTKS